MRKSTKAALLSGLVFPGLGHLVLKRYLRGAILIVVAFVALSVLITVDVQQALEVVDRIESGEVALNSDAIAAAVSESESETGFPFEDVSLAALIAAWLFGIVDCVRLGRAGEK
jgi:hypothetical protein